MDQLIECVPNFSEGCDQHIIDSLASEIRSVKGVKLLNIDPGKAANRTVFTFVGAPQQVVEAAFLAIKKASELIDMSKQTGEHPRIGATDVCPLIPIKGISLQETSAYANKLGKLVGEHLKIPVFLYEASQPNKNRSNLAEIRKGEYEGMFKKIKQTEWKPDFGPSENSVKSGATVIGARNFLIAYNVNLNTSSVTIATTIAQKIRESGYFKREGDSLTGTIVKDNNGIPIKIQGTLKSVKAIGWYIKEYGCAQVSINITDIHKAPIHIVFDEVVKTAKEYNLEVMGSELIGLIPLNCLLEAGKHYFKNDFSEQKNVSEKELINSAIKALGLNQLTPFNPEKRIIEYLLADKN